MDTKKASLLKRLLAYTIDILPIVLIVFAIAYFIGFDEVLRKYKSNRNDLLLKADFYLWRNRVRDLSFLLYCVYCCLLEASSLEGTFGKYIVKIKVIKNDGSKLSVMDSVKRNLFKIISYVPLQLGFIWALFNKNKYAWHDSFAKTSVIEKNFNLVGE
jgi:Predicted membrane protein/domain